MFDAFQRLQPLSTPTGVAARRGLAGRDDGLGLNRLPYPDVMALALVVLVGLVPRLALAHLAPVLLAGDSETYIGPAVDLARGTGFDLLLKRTPGYPLLLALVFSGFGENLAAVAWLQHVLGLLTSVLTYLLARLIGGIFAGLLAGCATALAGNLLVFERLIMTEPAFTTALVAAVLALVIATRTAEARASPGLWSIWLVVAGLAVGVATLLRPVAQALLLLAPLAALPGPRSWRRALVAMLLVVVGFATLVLPWKLTTPADETGASIGALGQTLVGRTARHDRRDPATDSGFVFYDPARHDADPDAERLRARQILQEAANRGSSGRAVHTRIRKETGLSEAQTDRLMRDLAIAAILERPAYYLTGTLQRFGRLWTTPSERLTPAWNDQNTIRRAWEHEASRRLIEQPQNGVDPATADELASLFQPARLGGLYPVLFLLGVAAAIADRRLRLTLVPAFAALGLIGLSVALVGGVARYRYPEDPLIFVVAAVGVSWAVSSLRCRLAR